MTADRDLDRLLPRWLEESSVASPPADLLSRSLARVDATRQQPAWLVGGVSIPRPLTTARVLVPAWLLIALVALLAVALVAAGSRLFLTAVVFAPSPTWDSALVATVPPPAAVEPTPSRPLGGAPIIAHSYARWRDPGPFQVVAVDAGTGAQTMLGTLPGDATTHTNQAYSFQASDDLRHVLIDRPVSNEDTGQNVQNATAAAAPFGFLSTSGLDANCCRGDVMWSMTLSPAGDRVAAIHDGPPDSNTGFEDPIEIVVVHLDGTVATRLPIPAAMNWVGPLAWAADGSAVSMIGCRPCNKALSPTEAQTSDHSHIYIAPIDGSPWRELLDVNNGWFSAEWAPDGSRLAVEAYVCATGSYFPRCDPTEAKASLGTLDLGSGALTTLGDAPGLGGIDWSPDGALIAFAGKGGVFTVDARTGEKATLAAGSAFGAGGSASRVEWSPDGSWLMVEVGHEDLAGPDVWIVRADGSELHKILTGYAGAIW
jgi:hypothetical protein